MYSDDGERMIQRFPEDRIEELACGEKATR
jgi:hypothetical protein